MMNAFLLKRLAVALTVSQIFTRPDVKTHFDPQTDQKEVIQIMNQGCTKIVDDLSKDFPELKQLDVDQLLQEVISNAKASNQKFSLTAGLDLNEVKKAYGLFCKGESAPDEDSEVSDLINYFNDAMKDLPDPAKLKGLRLPESSVVLDGSGQQFTEVYQDNNRRKWVPLSQTPDYLQKAFIAAEDKNFYKHHGVDERGVARAAMNNASGATTREQGGSTITQQVVKNLLVGDDLTFERKMREMVVATRLEKIAGKPEILELYLNYVFLGRASWGIEMAAESYFGKPVSKLSIAEAAFLAGLPKGPNYYNPDLYPDRSLERTKYVLNQMKDNGFITAQQLTAAEAQASQLKLIAYRSPRTRGAFYFVDELVHKIKSQFSIDPTEKSLVIRSTLQPELQTAVEGAVQEGLVQYELKFDRAHFSGAEKNISSEIDKLKKTSDGKTPIWRQALRETYLPLYDVHWPAALVLQTGRGDVRVGLKDGRILRLKAWSTSPIRKLKIYDVVHVKVDDSRKTPVAELRYRPEVQGAAMVVENKTGKILAMTGGFSYPLSQLNRAMHMVRQPGSTIKPPTYLAALNAGYQPNTLILDAPITLAPIERGAHYWSPSNYERDQGSSLTTIRRALENSRNRVTARLLNYISDSPGDSLDIVRKIMVECGAHPNPERHYAIVIGGIETTMENMATCYTTIANGGGRPNLHLIESVDEDGKSIYQFQDTGLIPVQDADAVSFFQMRTLLQGVVERGTAYKLDDDLKDMIPTGQQIGDYVAGKTGTSQWLKDAWFIGFTNDVTIAVWVGYDNATEKTSRTLGKGATGATVAAPIFESIFRAVADIYPLKPFPGPTGVLAKKVLPVATVLSDGQPIRVASANDLPSGVIIDYLRADQDGDPTDTWQKIARYEPAAPYETGRYDDDESYAAQQQDPRYAQQQQYYQQQNPFSWLFPRGPYGYPGYSQGYNRPPYGPRYQGNPYGYRYRDGYTDAPMTDPSQRRYRQPRRMDPDWNW